MPEPAPELTIRDAEPPDWDSIWPFFTAIVGAGETFPYDTDTDRGAGERIWMRSPARTSVAEAGGSVVGSAIMGPNRGGPGSHVATASYMVDPALAGRGIGRALVEDSLEWLRGAGFRAIQFNAVAATNTGALALYRSLGFEVIGTVPEGFDHPVEGFVDLHSLHRPLWPRRRPVSRRLAGMGTRVVDGVAGLRELIGETIGPADGITIDQARIDAYADVCGDHQWIHTDPDRAAKESPFGKTIAHGNLTLSLIEGFRLELIEQRGVKMGINYGFEKVRYPAPVPVDSVVVASLEVVSVDDLDGGWAHVVSRFDLRVEGAEKPSCIAESVTRLLADD